MKRTKEFGLISEQIHARSLGARVESAGLCARARGCARIARLRRASGPTAAVATTAAAASAGHKHARRDRSERDGERERESEREIGTGLRATREPDNDSKLI